MAKELPILICTDLIPATMDGRKTVTRRVMKIQPPDNIINSINRWENQPRGWFAFIDREELWPYDRLCGIQPYCRVGDLLWVRENWWDLGRMENGKWDGRLEIHTVKPRYVATCPDPYAEGIGGIIQPKRIPWRQCSGTLSSTWRKRPSIHMFKWIARTWLKVLDVRAERLQEITDTEAIREGIPDYPDFKGDSPRDDFQYLWDSLNAKRGYPWESNPWVWRYEFKQTISPASGKR